MTNLKRATARLRELAFAEQEPGKGLPRRHDSRLSRTIFGGLLALVFLASLQGCHRATAAPRPLVAKVRAAWDTMSGRLIAESHNVSGKGAGIGINGAEEVKAFAAVVAEAHVAWNRLGPEEMRAEAGGSGKEPAFSAALHELEDDAWSLNRRLAGRTQDEGLMAFSRDMQGIIDAWFPASSPSQGKPTETITFTSAIGYVGALANLLDADKGKTPQERQPHEARAIRLFNQAINDSPKAWELRSELGWTYFDRLHRLPEAAEAFRAAAAIPGARAGASRMAYRSYELLLDFNNLWPALEYAKSQGPDDQYHQHVVDRDLQWWKKHEDDPAEHRREILKENTARRKLGLDYYLYPNDPYWSVCPRCGLPTKKGAKECSVCHNHHFR